MEFTHELEARLISLVEERRCLWNSKDLNYHSKSIKEAAYREILDQLGGGFTESMVKSKWANLRSQFQREMRKIKESAQTGGVGGPYPVELYVPKWAHFQRMQFVRTATDDLPLGGEASCPLPCAELVPENSVDHIPETREHETSQAGPSGHTPNGTIKRKPVNDGYCSFKRFRETNFEDCSMAPQPPTPPPLPLSAPSSMDQCRAFGLMMENSVREVPEGANRDLAILVAYQALVRYKLTLNGHGSEAVDLTLSELFRS
ncbi:unnamed protein product [Ixodes hexagonus]